MVGFRQKPELTRTDALLCVPGKNRLVKEKRLESGELVLSYPQIYKAFFQKIRDMIKISSPKTYTRKIELDQLGIDVWSMIDGKKDINSIVREFATLHRIHVRESEISVTLFIKSLGEKGLIVIKDRS